MVKQVSAYTHFQEIEICQRKKEIISTKSKAYTTVYMKMGRYGDCSYSPIWPLKLIKLIGKI